MTARAAAGFFFRGQERLLGRPTFAFLDMLERTRNRSRAEVLAVQREHLNRLLLQALLHSPWHAQRLRAAGLERAIRAGTVAVEDLAALPLMDKQAARRHGAEMVWHGVPGGAWRYSTGGSSGEPLIFHYGRERQAADAATRLRGRGWWGVRPGDKELYLWGAPVELDRRDRLKRLRDTLVNHRILNAFAMSPARMDTYLEVIRRWRPVALYGYASSLALLAAHALTGPRRPVLSHLKAVFTTGEPLYPHQRAVIREAFGVPVANEYGCRDGGLIAHEAPDGQMRVTDECCVVEVLDATGRPVAPGLTGELVLTGLFSGAQPFIRYQTGDRVSLDAAPPTDARPLAVLGKIEGRQTDLITRSDGTLMHALSLIYVLREQPGIAAFKCIQHAPTYMEVLIVPGPEWNAAGAAAVSAGLRARLGQDVEVALQLREAIPPEASGKHRYVVSHVALPSRFDGLLPTQE